MMMKINLSILAVSCALVLAIPLSAANGPAVKTQKNTTKITASAWRPETLSGKIAMVDPAHSLVVVKTADGVPFDMDITGKTRIKSGNQSVTIKDLTNDTNKNVSVEFVPEHRGDVARSIRIIG